MITTPSPGIRKDCSVITYLAAAQLSNQASAPIFLGKPSSFAFGSCSSSNAKLTGPRGTECGPPLLARQLQHQSSRRAGASNLRDRRSRLARLRRGLLGRGQHHRLHGARVSLACKVETTGPETHGAEPNLRKLPGRKAVDQTTNTFPFWSMARTAALGN